MPVRWCARTSPISTRLRINKWIDWMTDRRPSSSILPQNKSAIAFFGPTSDDATTKMVLYNLFHSEDTVVYVAARRTARRSLTKWQARLRLLNQRLVRVRCLRVVFCKDFSLVQVLRSKMNLSSMHAPRKCCTRKLLWRQDERWLWIVN